MAGQPVDGVLMEPDEVDIGFGKAVSIEERLDDPRRGVRTPRDAHAAPLP